MRASLLLLLVALSGCIQEGGPKPADDQAPPSGSATVDLVPIDDGPGQAFEPMVAIDPRDPMHLVVAASEHRQGDDGLVHRWNVAYASFDGGRSWSRSEIPGGPSAGPAHPLAAATDMGDAVVAIAPDGTVLFAGLALNIVDRDGEPYDLAVYRAYDVYVARSTDGGRSFDEVAVVASGRGVALIAPTEAPVAWHANDKEWIDVAEDGTALLGWTEIEFPAIDEAAVAQNDAMFAVSRDGGRTWTAPAQIATTGYSGSFPLIASDGSWYMALYNYNAGSVHLATSKDEGSAWTLQRLAQETPSVTWPTLFEHGGLLHYGYTAFANETHPAAHLLASSDGGATWETVVWEPSQGEASWPQHTFAVDGVGRLFVLGYDVVEGETAVVLTVHGGNTTHRVLLDRPLAGAVNARSHYLGLVGLDDGAYAAWVTGEPGAFDLVGAHVTWPA